VLYAPGLATVEEIRFVCEALAKPVNVLALPGLTVAEVFEAGAQRVSVGGALTWVAAKALADGGRVAPRRWRLRRALRSSAARRLVSGLAEEQRRARPSRGRRLLLGVELESAELGEDLVNRMRDAGVLINRTGPKANVLKVRPPLVFTTERVGLLLEALAASRA
jgi:acetylornithine/succinyldiaminopimelate/putrescine aminotransferase